MLTSSASWAQDAQPAPFTAGWRNGFVLQSANEDNRLQIGAVVQFDGRFSVNYPRPITNTFTIKKARATFQGRVAKFFDFRVIPEFGNGAASIVDAYVDIRFSPAFRLRQGKDKTPLGYELLQSDSALLFPERSLLSSLIPNRDVGIQVQGDLSRGKLSYAGGIFNGIPDGTSTSTDMDANSDKELAGRVLVIPFRDTATPAAFLNNFGFAIGGSTGDQAGALPSFRTTAGQTYFSYIGTPSAATANGSRTRVSPAAFLFYRSFGVFSEYARTTQAVARLGQTSKVTNAAWEVTSSYLLTGEAASYGLPVPRKPFDPSAGQWGAVQIAARYAVVQIDDEIFELGLAAAGASHKATQASVGLNWYPVGPFKYYAMFEHTVFDDNDEGARPAESLVLFRAQLAF